MIIIMLLAGFLLAAAIGIYKGSDAIMIVGGAFVVAAIIASFFGQASLTEKCEKAGGQMIKATCVEKGSVINI